MGMKEVKLIDFLAVDTGKKIMFWNQTDAKI